jgi:membrane fusion protein, multidrug efflux system
MTLQPISQGSEVRDYLTDFKRLFSGGVYLLVGLSILAIAAKIGWSRLTQITISNALINARVIRVRAPSEGRIKAIFAQPGTSVAAGDTLARIEQSPEQKQQLLQLQGEKSSLMAQLRAATALGQMLKQQLQGLNQAQVRIARATTAVTAVNVTSKQSQVDAARSQANLARQMFKRYQTLANAGAIAQAVVDEKKAAFRGAEATLKQAQSDLSQAQTEVRAMRRGDQPSTAEMSVVNQRQQLWQSWQAQASLIASLKAQLTSVNQKLQEMESRFSHRHDLVVNAPISGVLYSRNHEPSETIDRFDPIVSVLDCQDLWVEGVIGADQANLVDVNRPAYVQMAGAKKPIRGKIELIQSMSHTLTGSPLNLGDRPASLQVQAVQLAVSPDLAGQPIVRVTVRIPQLPQLQRNKQFCGVGQATSITLAKTGWHW